MGQPATTDHDSIDLDATLDGGCARPDQLFGLWAIEETRFRSMVGEAKAADLVALRKEARKARKEAAGTTLDRPLYGLTGDGIAVIEVTGPMTKYETSFQAILGGTSTLRARRALRDATRNPEVLGIMVVFDSPGGTIAGTADLHDDILAADRRKPTYTYAQDLMASAALWAGAAGRKVFANKSAEIGSIGVYAVVYDTSGVYAQEGVKVHVISSAPPLKGAGVQGTEITPPQLAEWERQIKDLADLFVGELAAGRRMDREKAKALATGQVWVADKARENGLIDDVVSLDEAMRRLRSEAMNEQDLKKAQDATAAAEQKAKDEAAARAQAEEKLADAQKKLDALEAEKRTARFAGDAEAVGAPKEFAKVLDALEAKGGAELYSGLLTQLKAFKAQIEAGEAFKEKGSKAPVPGGASAADQIQSLAIEAVKDGKAKTIQQAVALVAREKPELYKQHLAEQKKAS